MSAGSIQGTGDAGKLIAAYERVADLTPEARERELETMRQNQPALAGRLERMLAREAEATSWLERLEQTLAGNLAAELDSAWAPGRVIGPYRLERLLATGGMGAVFLARKADGELKRPVALKLVPPGLVNDETRARFRQERDLLAALVHPNIAQLLDAGVTDAGQPWFAMEYIDGSRFLDWCRHGADGLDAGVRRFLDLVDAVQFAHRNLVVHGDIKPGNVMVDHDGRLRLLDFGIARLMSEMPDDGAVRYYTARYAAPEVRDGQAPAVASDVFSLGVMLAELIDLPGSTSSSPPIAELRCIAERATRDAAADRYEASAGYPVQGDARFRSDRPQHRVSPVRQCTATRQSGVKTMSNPAGRSARRASRPARRRRLRLPVPVHREPRGPRSARCSSARRRRPAFRSSGARCRNRAVEDARRGPP